MLTAWDRAQQRTIVLPDYESRQEAQVLREQTRLAELVCPECQQPLWLHAGNILIWHFAHRRLSDCPLSRISREVLCARRLVYRFFQSRIASGKLTGEIQLEPVLADLPEKVRVDLLLRRAEKPAVAVVLLDKGLKPDVRGALPSVLKSQQLLFRPVFLCSRLKPVDDQNDAVLLDPTQREFRLKSPYDLPHAGTRIPPATLHFVDGEKEWWTTLRGLVLWHAPQSFFARKRFASPLDALLWRESHAEWVHEGEAEALRKFLDDLKRERARKAEQAREAEQARKAEAARRLERAREAEALRRTEQARLATLARPKQPAHPTAHLPQTAVPPHATATPAPAQEPAPAMPAQEETEHWPVEPDPLPAWIVSGLVCVGCGQRTTKWQNAKPGADQCVCHACFAAGVRLR
jgi:hypothetical protein